MRNRRRLADDIAVYLKQITFEGVSRVRVNGDRMQWRAFVDTVMNAVVV